MAEYISREAAKRIIDDIDTWAAGWRDYAKQQVDSIPAADVVEVVRCRDCIRADKYGHCEMQNFWGTRDDFCSRGERRKNG